MSDMELLLAGSFRAAYGVMPAPCYPPIYGATAEIARISYGGRFRDVTTRERWLAVRAEMGWFPLSRAQGWRQGRNSLEIGEAADASLPGDNRRPSGSGAGEVGS